MSNVIGSITPGHLRVLLIDLTRNERGFEHSVSKDIFHLLADKKVGVATQGPLLLDSETELTQIFDNPDLRFNALLLVAHGGPDSVNGETNAVRIPSGKSNWFFVSGLLPRLRDKLVCLAVCYGSCRDAVEAFIDGEMFALTLVAPKTKLSGTEARLFYPAFFDELNRSTVSSIPLDVVQICVESNNHLANHKMRVDSPAKKL